MRISDSTVTHDTAENDQGFEVECVYARCTLTGREVGPIWGSSERSIRRALATLSEKCSCRGFHQTAKRSTRQSKSRGLGR
jgi:hypothetical protein